MNNIKVDKIKVGDRIKFRAVTRHSDRTAWRTVTAVEFCGERTIQVRYHGWPKFQVRDHEILHHYSSLLREDT